MLCQYLSPPSNLFQLSRHPPSVPQSRSLLILITKKTQIIETQNMNIHSTNQTKHRHIKQIHQSQQIN